MTKQTHSKDSMRRILEIMGLFPSSIKKPVVVISTSVIEALAIDRDEIMESAKHLGYLDGYDKGRASGYAEGMERTENEIRRKYKLILKDKKEREEELKRRVETKRITE